MRQHAGVFAANFSSNLLWQNCFAPKKSAFCAEPRRVAAGILDVCQGGATTGLRETRLLRRMFSYARRPKAVLFCVMGKSSCRGRRPRRPVSAAAPRCHCEARSAAAIRFLFLGRRIPTPVTRSLARNDGVGGGVRTPRPTDGHGIPSCRGRRPRRPVVGADDPVRPFARTPCGFVGGDAHIAPPESMHILRRDTWVPPYRRVR